MCIQVFHVHPTVRITQRDKYFHQILQWLVLRNCVDRCQVWLKQKRHVDTFATMLPVADYLLSRVGARISNIGH